MCRLCGYVGREEMELPCSGDARTCHTYALRQIEGKLPANAPWYPPIVHPPPRTPTEQEYDELRVKLDEIGMRSMEYLVAQRDMDPKVAGERIAEFNDKVIAAIRSKYSGNTHD